MDARDKRGHDVEVVALLHNIRSCPSPPSRGQAPAGIQHWIPAFAGMSGGCRSDLLSNSQASNSHASSPVLFGEAPGRPVFRSFSFPPQMRGGWRAKWRNHCSLCARIPSRKYGAPLGAPPRQACAVWAHLRRLPYGAGPRFSWPSVNGTPSVSQAPGGRLLLAARRSPGAARVRALRGTPAGAASGPTMTPLETPLDGRTDRNIFI